MILALSQGYPYNKQLKSIKNKVYTAAVIAFIIKYINEKKTQQNMK